MIKYLILLGVIIGMFILSIFQPDLLRYILAFVASIPLIVMLIATAALIWDTFYPSSAKAQEN